MNDDKKTHPQYTVKNCLHQYYTVILWLEFYTDA